MNILFNCTVNREGGAVQNAANFICLARNDKQNSFMFLVSLPVYNLLSEWGGVDERIVLTDHPLSSRKVQEDVARLECYFKPDIVYTMAGPSYLKFKNNHVLGVSDGYITHAGLDSFFYGRSFFNGFKHFLKTIVKGCLSRFEGDFFIFQTETSRAGYCQRFFISKDKTRVIPNAVGKAFSGEEALIGREVSEGELVILCPSADYSHKDLFIIKRIAELVHKEGACAGKKLVFIVTVNEASLFSKAVSDINEITPLVSVYNRGPYSYAQASELYSECDVVFMPSILETFSTSYLEALAAGKLLVVADKLFAREICADAAIYFTPKSERSALSSFSDIVKFSSAPDYERSRAVLHKYGDYEKRYSAIIADIYGFYKLASRRGV